MNPDTEPVRLGGWSALVAGAILQAIILASTGTPPLGIAGAIASMLLLSIGGLERHPYDLGQPPQHVLGPPAATVCDVVQVAGRGADLPGHGRVAARLLHGDADEVNARDEDRVDVLQKGGLEPVEGVRGLVHRANVDECSVLDKHIRGVADIRALCAVASVKVV